MVAVPFPPTKINSAFFRIPYYLLYQFYYKTGNNKHHSSICKKNNILQFILFLVCFLELTDKMGC